MSAQDRVGRFLRELRRRKVVQVTLAYAVVGWALIEFAATVEEPLGLPVWTDTLVIVLIAVGLPITIVLSWIFDIGPSGITATPREEERPYVGEGSVVSHFAILERLGEGGMGVVYRARDTRLDRLVALKFLPASLSENERANRRFYQEARAAAKLDHANICTIHEIGTLDDGRSYIAMPLYEGHTLARLVRESGRRPPEEVIDVGRQVARGLAAAHQADIVHRDIKPGNLFLTEDGVLKILDFGIAKMAGVDLTREGGALGTVAYMSPEQVRRQEVDGRTDLWALGVVLYELCAGERPFIGLDSAAVLHGILELDPPSLRDLLPEVPLELSELVERCLARDPDDRPPDATAVAEALASMETVSTVTAPSDPEISAEVDPSPSALASEGERRQLAVLGMEWAGRSRLEESLSPEEVDRLAEACRAVTREVIRRHGGTVHVETGNATQALFGIPTAGEDDAIRAVRTARELCSRVDEQLADADAPAGPGVRCGVDVGRAVVRRLDTEGEAGDGYRVVGGPADRSARLAALADVGQVLVTEDCRRLVAPFFDVEETGSLPAREGGRTNPTFTVGDESGVRTRLEAAAVTGLTELRGRESELATLLRACEAAAGGDGRFVPLVGEAGVGKSRLLHELEERLDPARFDVLSGRCQSSGGDVPYLPFIGVLRERLELVELEGAPSEALVSERVGDIEPELRDFTPFYLELLSIGEEERALQEALGGEQFRVGLVESLSAILTLGAREKPTVVLLEDWHWVDAASRQVLRQLLDMLSAYPLAIVVTARPEAELDWGTPAGHTSIVLGPLAPADSDAVARSVLNADRIPQALTRFLHERTGGNPFFLEEVCQALREEGTLRVEEGRVHIAGTLEKLELPETVQGVLRTRLDRLDADARRVLRYAAVVGREFTRDVLEDALGEETEVRAGLDRLRDLGLIQQIRIVPTHTYRFKHALTQDVAYDGLLERQRIRIHGAVGEAIEALHAGRLNERLDRLAEHFALAGRWEKALEHQLSAADRLWSLSEFQEAVEVQDRALEWVEQLDDPEARFEKKVEVLLRQERLTEYLGLRDRQQGIIDQLVTMLDPEEHPEHVATTLVRQGDLHILTRDHEGAERALEEALRLSRELGDPSRERHALRSMGLLLWHQNRHGKAIELGERTLALDRRLENREGQIGSLANLGQLHRAKGDYERALDYLEQALELERSVERRSPGLVVKESYILHLIGSIHAALGDHERGREYLKRARASVESTKSTINVVQMHFHVTALARLSLEEGHVDEALDLYRESVHLCRKTRHLEGLSTSLRLLGDVLLNLERHEEALPRLEEAADLYDRMHDRPAEASMRRGIAVAREGLGRLDEAGEAWERAEELASVLSEPALQIEAAEGVGRCSRRSDPSTALEAYERALDLATSTSGYEAKTGELRYAVGLVQWEFGAYEEALKSFDRARESLLDAGKPAEAGLALNSVGRTLRDLGRLNEARERLEEALELHRADDRPLLEAHALATLGDIEMDAGEPTRAAEWFTAALELRRTLDDPAGQGWMLTRLARAQRATGSEEGAAYYLGEAEVIASESGDLELAHECETLRRKGDGEGGEGEEGEGG